MKRLLFISSLFLFFHCGHFLGAKGSTYLSVFEEGKIYNLDPFKFEQYDWNEKAKNENKLYLKGLVDYFYKKEYRKALETFEDCIALYSDDVRPHIRLIESYARLGENGRALTVIDNVLKKFEELSMDPQMNSYREELLSGKTIDDYRKRKERFKRILLYVPKKLWQLVKLLPFI